MVLGVDVGLDAVIFCVGVVSLGILPVLCAAVALGWSQYYSAALLARVCAFAR